MQKWRKVLLVIVFIAALLGGFIGFYMAESGVGEIEVLDNIDVFSIFMLFLLILMVICMIYDIYKIYKDKKQFGNSKIKLMIKTRKRLRNVLILLVVITIFEFAMLVCFPSMHSMPLCFIVLILTLLQWCHYRVQSGINENGILHWGVYHSWSAVKSYEIVNETVLEMNVVCKYCGIKYNNEIKFDFNEEDKEDIERLLADKITYDGFLDF